MKLLSFVAVFLPLLVTSFRTWEQYCVYFQKNCSDTSRRTIYQQRIADLSQITEYTPRQSNMTDMTEAERQAMTGAHFQNPYGQATSRSSVESSVGSAPSSFNWEDQGIKTSVKNQGGCGSCWSFAAVAQAQAKLIKDKKADSSIDLSEQAVLKCSKYSTCDKGYMLYAMKSALKLPTEEQYPYSPYQDQDSQICQAGAYQAGTDFKRDLFLSDNQIITLLLQHGPLAIGIRTQNGWYQYGSGIYRCAPSDLILMNHEVLLVGYTPEYWIIKNQWGDHWGQNGYIYVTRDPQRNCEIGIQVNYIIGESTVPASNKIPEKKKLFERLSFGCVTVLMIFLMVTWGI